MSLSQDFWDVISPCCIRQWDKHGDILVPGLWHLHHPVLLTTCHHSVFEHTRASLLSKSMVITWRRSDSGDVLSHMIHVWPSWLVLLCFACPPCVLPPQEWRFLAWSSFVLLNAKRQFVWYFAPFLLSVASIPPPSSSLAGSTANDSALISFICVLFMLQRRPQLFLWMGYAVPCNFLRRKGLVTLFI